MRGEWGGGRCWWPEERGLVGSVILVARQETEAGVTGEETRSFSRDTADWEKNFKKRAGRAGEGKNLVAK